MSKKKGTGNMEQKIKKIMVLGLGKVGKLVGDTA